MKDTWRVVPVHLSKVWLWAQELERALNDFVPKNAPRESVQVFHIPSAISHLSSATITVFIKYWLPEEGPEEFFAVEDGDPEHLPAAAGAIADSSDPFDHESGGPNIAAAGDAQGKFAPEESGYSDKG